MTKDQRRLFRIIRRRQRRVRALLDRAAIDLANDLILFRKNYKSRKPFFKHNRGAANHIDKTLRMLRQDLVECIRDGDVDCWLESSKMNDALVRKYVRGTKAPSKMVLMMRRVNLNALGDFING